jgi:hypothetical protein
LAVQRCKKWRLALEAAGFRFIDVLGFRLSRTGRTFKIIDTIGELAVNSKPAMTLTEIESWIGEHIKPGS